MPEPICILAAVLISSAGIMTILVFYTLRHAPPAATPVTVTVTTGFMVTAGLHLWRRNAVISVMGGAAVHVALASTLPAWP